MVAVPAHTNQREGGRQLEKAQNIPNEVSVERVEVIFGKLTKL